MFSQVYHLVLRFLMPTGLCSILLVAALIARKRKRLQQALVGGALALLLIGGNGWLVGSLARSLEWRYLPPDPMPGGDAIIVVSGGIVPKEKPRSTVEVTEAADRIIYAGYLFKQGKAPVILCTGGIVPGSTRTTQYADDTAELLQMLGIPGAALLTEDKSANTFENARFAYPLLQQRNARRVLLVTSAMHMPRALGTFRKNCPGLEFVPAPTDFSVTEHKERRPRPWWAKVSGIAPSAGSLAHMNDLLHEFLGLAYYRIRGWL